MEILVAPALIVGATVVLAFVFTRGYALLAGRFNLPPLSDNAKKAATFLTAVGITAYAGQAYLPAPGGDLADYAFQLAAYGSLVFATAKPVYDKIWKALVNVK